MRAWFALRLTLFYVPCACIEDCRCGCFMDYRQMCKTVYEPCAEDAEEGKGSGDMVVWASRQEEQRTDGA